MRCLNEQSKLDLLVDQITRFVFEDFGNMEIKFDTIEEYCLKNLLTYQQENVDASEFGHGELYILNYIKSLKEAYEYEKYEPSRIKQPQDEKEDILRKGAYFYLERCLGEVVKDNKDSKSEEYILAINSLEKYEKDHGNADVDDYTNKILLEMSPEEQNIILTSRLEQEVQRGMLSLGTNRFVQVDAAITREKRRMIFE